MVKYVSNMEFKDVHGVVWDLDGTLIDSFNVYFSVLQEVTAETGHVVPSRDVLVANYHGSLRDTFRTVLQEESEKALDVLEQRFAQIQNSYYEGSTDHHFFEDAVHLAQSIARLALPQFIITNRKHGGQGNASPRSIVAASSVLADCVHDIRCCDEVVCKKPDPRAVEGWFEAHNVQPKDLLIIGDQFVDAALAHNIGARAVLVDRNGHGIPNLETLKEPVPVVTDLRSIQLYG